MIDANFRARCKDKGIDDIEMGSGWSYYVEEKAYQEHLKACANSKEVSGCVLRDFQYTSCRYLFSLMCHAIGEHLLCGA